MTPLRILVADDYADAREMLAFFLERLGHTVATASDGADALAVAVTFEPEVAILDIGMPGISGHTLARELRKRRGDGLTIVALSGLGEPADKARAAEAGFDRYFTKPVDIKALSEFLAEVKTPGGPGL
ncbi:MAG TPA: response regulator [Vicinamibacterales bacterium]|nr:response regulator [Vicinamibacterales bacterium]